jgi:hypothetical protein
VVIVLPINPPSRRRKGPPQRFIKGFRPVIHAREGRMLGIRQPHDGPVFHMLQEAIAYCMNVMVSHYESRLGMSDASIERFEGMVGWPAAAEEEGVSVARARMMQLHLRLHFLWLVPDHVILDARRTMQDALRQKRRSFMGLLCHRTGLAMQRRHK